MKNSNILSLLVVVVLIVAGIAYLSMSKVRPVTSTVPAIDVSVATSTAVGDKALKYEKAKELVAPSGFVNTNGLPITISQYIGKKVILLDIMTYSCINCIRTFPYLNDWYKKYEDKGLVIIGIHTPEFDFEKNIDNVKMAMAKYGIKFPVVLDNEYGTWTAYKNLYWPRKYLIDKDGYIVYDHIGEGGYAETEKKIQELLNIEMPVTEGEVEQGTPGQSQETYFGSARAVPGADEQYLKGTWKILTDHVENNGMPASIHFPFKSKKVFFVASADKPVKVEIFIDGKFTNDITVGDARLYDVYSSDVFGSHTLELRPTATGLKAFTLTFGN